MWDLGLQEWVHVASTEIPELTLSNILSGILYRFRVTALTAEGGVSFPSDPSEPFVIDIPGVQVQPTIFSNPFVYPKKVDEAIFKNFHLLFTYRIHVI